MLIAYLVVVGSGLVAFMIGLYFDSKKGKSSGDVSSGQDAETEAPATGALTPSVGKPAVIRKRGFSFFGKKDKGVGPSKGIAGMTLAGDITAEFPVAASVTPAVGKPAVIRKGGFPFFGKKGKGAGLSKGISGIPLAGGITAEDQVAPSVGTPAVVRKVGLSFFGKKKDGRGESSKSTASQDMAPKEELRDIKQALVDKLDQKCIKLEQILEEKNRILAQLQKDLEDERAHRGEFESLKTILQQQIDDLKAQNRSLKDELERILQENLHLQTGLVMPSDITHKSQRPAGGRAQEPRGEKPERAADYVCAEPDDIIPTNPPKTGSEGSLSEGEGRDGSDKSLSLKDIFGEEDKPKSGV